MAYLGKYPSRDRAEDVRKPEPNQTSRGMGVAERRDGFVEARRNGEANAAGHPDASVAMPTRSNEQGRPS